MLLVNLKHYIIYICIYYKPNKFTNNQKPGKHNNDNIPSIINERRKILKHNQGQSRQGDCVYPYKKNHKIQYEKLKQAYILLNYKIHQTK